MSTWMLSTVSLFSAGPFAEGGPELEVPTLPTGQALILMICLVFILVLALYWNARSYKLPEGIGTHGDEHSENHSQGSDD